MAIKVEAVISLSNTKLSPVESEFYPPLMKRVIKNNRWYPYSSTKKQQNTPWITRISGYLLWILIKRSYFLQSAIRSCV